MGAAVVSSNRYLVTSAAVHNPTTSIAFLTASEPPPNVRSKAA